MQTVFKFPLSYRQDVRLSLPEEARVVQVGLDGAGDPCLWVLLDPALPTDGGPDLSYGIYGTGGQVPDHKEYVGTFFSLPFVWHIFRDKAPA